MRTLALALCIPALACAQEGPRLRILGIAQDGGVPHAACACDTCDAARADPDRAHAVASLALITTDDDGADRVYLIDATPDIRAQLDMLADVRDAPDDRVDRAPVDGVLLTHAHIGHYTGLMFLGFEAVSTHATPVWCTPDMAAFLRDNAPWSQLVSLENIEITEIAPDRPFTIDDVEIEAITVPHRDELSDTVAYVVRTPARAVLYVPDTEPWHTWTVPLPDVLQREDIDVLIVDATFYSADELPGRPPSSIGHPLVVDTMDLLQTLVDEGLDVRFTHLNHSNPALDPASPARAEIERRGYTIARQGDEITLAPPPSDR